MAKTANLEKVKEQADKLELTDLLDLQKFIVEKIAEEQKGAEALIETANRTIEMIRTNGKQ